MYGLTADEQDAYHLLKLAESGRPEEQMSQFVASMISCGDMSTDQITQFFSEVLGRVTDLLNSEDLIWTNLMPGGNQQPLMGAEEILEEIAGMFPIRDESAWPEIYNTLLAYGVIDQDNSSNDVKIYLLGEHKCDRKCWFVVNIETGTMGYWQGETFDPLWVTSDVDHNPNDILAVDGEDVDWIDIPLTIEGARKTLREEGL
jgi:hypothetical protein